MIAGLHLVILASFLLTHATALVNKAQLKTVPQAWRRWLELAHPRTNFFTLDSGDSIQLDCDRLEHVQAAEVKLTYRWMYFDRQLLDEGDEGRLRIVGSRGGQLVMDDVTESDSGVYGCHANASRFAQAMGAAFDSDVEYLRWMETDEIPVGLFVLRVERLREFEARIGEIFNYSLANWSRPLKQLLELLNLQPGDWQLEWESNLKTKKICPIESACGVNFRLTQTENSHWRLLLLNVMSESRAAMTTQTRVIAEFRLRVHPPLGWLYSFPLSQHQYYMVYSVFLLALFVLTLHLVPNLTWIPYAFDIVPDETSDAVAYERSGLGLASAAVDSAFD